MCYICSMASYPIGCTLWQSAPEASSNIKGDVPDILHIFARSCNIVEE